MVDARVVAKRCEPASDPGTCTIGTGGAMAGPTRLTTLNYSTAIVTGKFTLECRVDGPSRVSREALANARAG
jgi:hypothetical protein